MTFLMSPKHKNVLLFGLLVVPSVFMVMYAYVNEIGPFSYDMMYVPIHPGAQQVRVHTAEKITVENDTFYQAGRPYKVVEFVTADKPERLFAFYRNDLANRSSEDWRVDLADEKPGFLHLICFGRRDISPPMYVFAVKTKQKDGLTYVTVERSYEAGM